MPIRQCFNTSLAETIPGALPADPLRDFLLEIGGADRASGSVQTCSAAIDWSAVAFVQAP
jgi:hypothetical protein